MTEISCKADDRAGVMARADFHLEYRWLMPDGPIKHLYVAAACALTTPFRLI